MEETVIIDGVPYRTGDNYVWSRTILPGIELLRYHNHLTLQVEGTSDTRWKVELSGGEITIGKVQGLFPDDDLVIRPLPSVIGEYDVHHHEKEYYLVTMTGQVIITPTQIIVDEHYTFHQERWTTEGPIVIINSEGERIVLSPA